MQSSTLRFLHWIMAIIVFAMIGSGLVMINMKDTNTIKWYLYTHHESVGMLLLFLLFVRLAVRSLTKYSTRYKALPRPQMVIARTSHTLLYLTILGMTVSGYFQAAPYGVYLFDIPIPVVRGEFYAAGIGFYIHAVLGKVIIFLISIHIFGYFFHRYIGNLKSK